MVWRREGLTGHKGLLPPKKTVVDILGKHRSSKGFCYAIFHLGRLNFSKNGYERFLFSRSLHSSPSHEAARPADFA